MLLSHNYNVTPDVVPPLSRDAFAAVFRQADALSTCRVQGLDHPHWMVDIRFDTTQVSAQQVGEYCAQALVTARRHQGIAAAKLPDLLVLGGLKITPATQSYPALQPGEWGVDVVETPEAAVFLQQIGWESTVAQKPTTDIFMVSRLGSHG